MFFLSRRDSQESLSSYFYICSCLQPQDMVVFCQCARVLVRACGSVERLKVMT